MSEPDSPDIFSIQRGSTKGVFGWVRRTCHAPDVQNPTCLVSTTVFSAWPVRCKKGPLSHAEGNATIGRIPQPGSRMRRPFLFLSLMHQIQSSTPIYSRRLSLLVRHWCELPRWRSNLPPLLHAHVGARCPTSTSSASAAVELCHHHAHAHLQTS